MPHLAVLRTQIYVAIDFGTTYSSIAWSYGSKMKTPTLVNLWPQGSVHFSPMQSDKVPTELAFEYDKFGPKVIWGFGIHPTMPRLQWFKLGLDEAGKVQLEMDTRSKNGDPRRQKIPHHSSSESLVRDYLTELRKYIFTVLEERVGKNGMNDLKITYFLTVPGIWSEKAIAQTLKCARAAGFESFHNSKIIMMSEPEASAIHTLSIVPSSSLKVGDTFVLCDAGGGTVDLITLTIIEKKPRLRMREAAPGSGGLCGSVFLNRRFEKLMRAKFPNFDGWDSGAMERAIQRFEQLKRKFAPPETDKVFSFPTLELDFDYLAQPQRATLSLSWSEMQGIFDPIIDDIIKLLNSQLESSQFPVDALVIVGGFGQNKYLQHRIKRWMPRNIQMIVPENGWTAVTLGALRKCKFGNNIVMDSRMARKSYGVIETVEFDPRFHDKRRRFTSRRYSHDVIDVMNWFIRKGGKMDPRKEISMELEYLVRQRKSLTLDLEIYEYNEIQGTLPPLYPRTVMKRHVTLQVGIDLQPDEFENIDRTSGGYYRVPFELRVRPHATHFECTVWVQGKGKSSVVVAHS